MCAFDSLAITCSRLAFYVIAVGARIPSELVFFGHVTFDFFTLTSTVWSSRRSICLGLYFHGIFLSLQASQMRKGSIEPPIFSISEQEPGHVHSLKPNTIIQLDWLLAEQ